MVSAPSSERRPGGPRSPFDHWPIQAYDPVFGYAWYAKPAAFVSQAHITQGTEEAARCVQDWIDLVLQHRAEEIDKAGGLLVFHDWRMAEGYTSAGRNLYLARMRARPRNYLRHSVTCIKSSPLFRMAVEAGNLVAALTARARVELAPDPVLPLAMHGIERPPPGSAFPGSKA
jgi:hypothetical protein